VRYDPAGTFDESTIQSVLFACTFNSVRSPMAAALLKWRCRGRLFVDSCGVKLGETDRFAVAVLDELGIDLREHHPRTFDLDADGQFDLVISLSPEAQHTAVELTRYSAVEIAYWPMPDPTAVTGSREVRMAEYRHLRDMIDRRIKTAFAPWVSA
jgi:protein-tyrosine-phosphatase